MTVWVDFETKSNCDLPKHGAYNYAQDLSTEVLCMAYAFDDEDVQLWVDGPLPDFTGHQIRAHNAAFERLIFWYVLQQNYPLEQFYCTAAEARANCAPGKLEDVGRFASASMRKDRRGVELVRKCCLPPFNTELLPELYEYCKQDVRTMRAVSQGMRQLTADELLDYHTNERVNDRGVLVDVALAKSAVRYAAQELAEVQGLVKEITEGAITSVRSRKMCAWVQARVGPQALALMTQEDGKISVDKSVRANLLALADESPAEVPPDVADVLQCASDIWSSSVAKFQRMADLADVEDHRVRGTSVFAGGPATGRYSSHGLQLQNMVRKTAKDPEGVRQIMLRGGKLDDVSATLKSMIRPALMAAPGKVLIVSDWSAIEGRVNPWLSTKGEDKLQVFRDKLDPYKVNASATFGVHYDAVTGDQRQVGKVQELALGFGGSVGAFASMGRIYGLHVSEAEAMVMVQAWRRANPWAVGYWSELERAYLGAMRNKNTEFTAGRVTYLFDGQHLWYMLPSGRVLCYPYARFDADGGVSYAKSAWKPKADAKHWPRARLWHGVACENCWAGNTLIITHTGLIPIRDVKPDDLIWDGVEWVPHAGVSNNGTQEVMQWLAVEARDVLGRIYYRWVPVIGARFGSRTVQGHSEGRATVRCECGRVDVLDARCLRRGGHRCRSCSAIEVSESKSDAHTITDPKLRALWAHRRSGAISRCYDPRHKAYPNYGARGIKVFQEWLGSSTLSRWMIGGCTAWTWIASTTTKATSRVIYALFRAAKTPETAESLRGSRSKASASASPSSESVFVKVGAATTQSRTTYQKDVREMKSPRSTGERTEVFDIVNCGPRHQYMVMTALGPVLAHNCTQAVANDLLRETLRQIKDCVLHVHDEVVCEVKDVGYAAEIERIMTTPPAWATGLPLAVEIKTMLRYSK